MCRWTEAERETTSKRLYSRSFDRDGAVSGPIGGGIES